MHRILNSMTIIAFGLLLLIGGLALYVYPLYGEWEHDRQADRPADVTSLNQRDTPRPALTPTVEMSAHVTPTATPESAPTLPAPVPISTPTIGGYGQPVWMVIPGIKVDSKVVEMQNNQGNYYVPGWDVGHHADSPNPGELGNSAYAGHVSTLNAGHVFARLKEAKVGDLVYVYTKTHRTDWVVTKTGTYGNKDASFLAPTREPRLTVYTCIGTFDWSTQDFSDRFAITADLLRAERRPQTTQ